MKKMIVVDFIAINIARMNLYERIANVLHSLLGGEGRSSSNLKSKG